MPAYVGYFGPCNGPSLPISVSALRSSGREVHTSEPPFSVSRVEWTQPNRGVSGEGARACPAIVPKLKARTRKLSTWCAFLSKNSCSLGTSHQLADSVVVGGFDTVRLASSLAAPPSLALPMEARRTRVFASGKRSTVMEYFGMETMLPAFQRCQGRSCRYVDEVGNLRKESGKPR